MPGQGDEAWIECTALDPKCCWNVCLSRSLKPRPRSPRDTTNADVEARRPRSLFSRVCWYAIGRSARTLVIEVRTAAIPAASGVIFPALASAAALAVVLALLTRPPT